MSYSIQTKDGIKINNIPDDVPRDSDDLRQRVAAARAKRDQQKLPKIDVAALQAQKTRPMPTATSGTSRGWDVVQDQGQGAAGGQGSTRDWGDSSQLTPEQMDQARLERVARIPEITGSMGNLSKNLGFLQAVGGMTAFDPDEFGKILTKADPAIGVATTPEGERIAVNNQTGQAFSINKLGPSLMDAVQFGGAVAAFTPAGRGGSIAAQALGGMATQAAIEGGQAAIGGEFNPSDVALAGVAPVAINATGKAIGAGIKKIRGGDQYIDDLAAGRPVLPSDASVPQLAGLPAKETAKRADIRNAIRQGSVESVGWSVDDLGRIVPDATQRELVRKGVTDKALVTLRDMSSADKKIALEMLGKAENNVKKMPGAEFDLPSNIIGRQGMKRFDVIVDAQKKASRDIGAAVKTNLSKKPVDISPEFDDFIDQLEGLRIDVFAKGGPNFSESLINSSNVTPIRNVLNRVKANYDDAAELHEIKQYITNQINYSKPNTKPLDSRAENALKAFRAKINQRLRDMSKPYAEANDRFAKAASTIKPFTDVMGKQFDPESDRVADYVGQELRKVLSNYRTSNNLVTAIKNLDEVAAEFGGKFDDSILDQVVLNSELERMFGSFKPNSAQGIAEKAGDLVLDRALGGAAGVVKAGGAAAKDKLMWAPPSKDNIEIIKKLKEMAMR